MCKSSALNHTIGLREGRRAFGRTVTQRPEDTPPDDGGQGDPLGEATAGFLRGPDIRRQWQPTPGQPCDRTGLSKGAADPLERPGRAAVAHSPHGPPAT